MYGEGVAGVVDILSSTFLMELQSSSATRLMRILPYSRNHFINIFGNQIFIRKNKRRANRKSIWHFVGFCFDSLRELRTKETTTVAAKTCALWTVNMTFLVQQFIENKFSWKSTKHQVQTMAQGNFKTKSKVPNQKQKPKGKAFTRRPSEFELKFVVFSSKSIWKYSRNLRCANSGKEKQIRRTAKTKAISIEERE